MASSELKDKSHAPHSQIASRGGCSDWMGCGALLNLRPLHDVLGRWGRGGDVVMNPSGRDS